MVLGLHKHAHSDYVKLSQQASRITAISKGEATMPR
jgi:hypothetical protein